VKYEYRHYGNYSNILPYIFVKSLALMLRFRDSHIRIVAGVPAILTDIFSFIPQIYQTNAGTAPTVHTHLCPQTSQLIHNQQASVSQWLRLRLLAEHHGRNQVSRFGEAAASIYFRGEGYSYMELYLHVPLPLHSVILKQRDTSTSIFSLTFEVK
jgi:hypothetical protein